MANVVTTISRALVVGYGSIGMRHTRILEALGCSVDVVTRRSAVHPQSRTSLADALRDRAYGLVVVANETSHHAAAIRTLGESGFEGLVLVEKPLCNPGDDLGQAHDMSVVIGYQLRFDPLMRALRDLTLGKTLVSVEIRACSYLPDWRPTRDYRLTESASLAAGGGVLRDLSHELDYMQWLCGDWRRVAAVGGHLSPLEIDTDDSYAALVQCERCPSVVLSLNYLDRTEERWVVVNTTEGTIRADIFGRSLAVDGRTVFSGSPADVEDTYVDQDRALLAGQLEGFCTLDEGAAIVGLIGAIETAATEGRWVSA